MATPIDPANVADFDQPLNTDPDFSTTHIFSTDDVTGTFDGATQGKDGGIVDFSGENGTKLTQDGVTLYPIDSEFGFVVTDFVGAESKVIDGVYTEGWVGDLVIAGEQAGIVVSDAPTDTFKTPATLGTWLAGIGNVSVKASTEHYTVMQGVLSDQAYPGDPDAVYPLDDNLILLSQNEAWDGQYVSDLLADQAGFGITDTNLDGKVDIKDLLNPNESTIEYDIAYGDDYSVTMKDDGKLLYRWGNMIKRPNDVRLEATLDTPDEWKEQDITTSLTKLYSISSAELVLHHTITNNPNDQVRPEDFENESAIGTLPTYEIIENYNGEEGRTVWASTDDYYGGDGTLYEAGTILRDTALADAVEGSLIAANGALTSDLELGFTAAWYTTMDREPFEPVLNEDGTEYETGPRWRLLPNKYGQDLPGVEIPTDPSDPLPVQSDEVKYEVGAETQTVLNLLDWATDISPLSISAGWQDNSGSVSVNGLNMSDDFDVALYIKGDVKPATVYSVELLVDYDEIEIHGSGEAVVGGAGDDYLVGVGNNTFTGGAGSDLFVVSYGTSATDIYTANTITDFTVGEDKLGFIGFDELVDFDVDLPEAYSLIVQGVSGDDLTVSVGGELVATLSGVAADLGVGATLDAGEGLSLLDSFIVTNPGEGVPAEPIVGTADADLLVGTEKDEIISGLGGDDTIYGNGGSDELNGDEGNDNIIGEVYDAAFDPAAAQMFRLYQTAFGRTADRAGHFAWSEVLASGATDLDAVAEQFVDSAEFAALFDGTSNSDFVEMLYEQAFDRIPSPAEVESWSSALDDGTLTRAEVLAGFSESSELRNDTRASELSFSRAGYQQDLADEAFGIAAATTGVLPASDTLEDVSLDLAEGVSLSDAAADLLATAEAQAIYGNTDNEVFVATVYETALDRTADAAGLAGWVATLDSMENTRADVVVGIVQSIEGINKMAAKMAGHMEAIGPDDVLNGGAGNDAFFGGIMADVFEFGPAEAGDNEIAGFESWDKLDVSAFGYATAAEAISHMSQVEEDVVFEDGAVTATLLETQLSLIEADNIMFA